MQAHFLVFNCFSQGKFRLQPNLSDVLVCWLMSKVHKLIALLFMVLWVPITAHCYLETIPGLEFFQCAGDNGGTSDCKGEGCCVVESGFYKVSEARDYVAVAPLLRVAVPPLLLDDSFATVEGPAGFEKLPPELPRSWQFISRTALPVRAPSFAS